MTTKPPSASDDDRTILRFDEVDGIAFHHAASHPDPATAALWLCVLSVSTEVRRLRRELDERPGKADAR